MGCRRAGSARLGRDILSFVVDVIADFLASLVNLDATLRSRLDASVDVKTSHLTLRQNILHVKVKNWVRPPTAPATRPSARSTCTCIN